nr:helix-hairpin-helix domain-containing protein [Myxococcus eversor]
MRRLGSVVLSMSLFVGCGVAETESPSPAPVQSEQQQAPLTASDVDVAPECQGILTFVNTATFAKLDQYLPSNVATNIVARRATASFVSLADLSSVSLVGEARLAQIESGARAEGAITSTCVGIIDQLAVSVDDQAELVSLVNSISDTELHDVLPYAWNGAVNLLNQRPYASAHAIGGTTGIGAVSLRNLRNAATLSKPLESLINAVNALPQPDHGAKMARHFNWYDVLGDRYYHFGIHECFGFEPGESPFDAPLRATPADAAEVRGNFLSALNFANRNNQLNPTTYTHGVNNLNALTEGRSFKGCYFGYANDPWSGNNVAFFVDTVSGFSLMTRTYWSE